jgi:undecaprenyl-diphosphatase
METLIAIDKQLFFLINGWHSPFWDFIMFWLSDKLIWIPLYVVFLMLLIRYYKWQTVIIMLFVAILMTLSDQISVDLFKNIFHRLRPCHDPEMSGLVHLVKDRCGGQYGFVSSHATNHFAIAVFLVFFLGSKMRYFTPLVLFWAAIIGYSRIYLGAHFPGDVICGALLGSTLGVVLALMCRMVLARISLKNRKTGNHKSQ